MTVADLKSLVSDPPQREVRVPMTEQEFDASIGELRAEWVNGEAIIMPSEPAPDQSRADTRHGDRGVAFSMSSVVQNAARTAKPLID